MMRFNKVAAVFVALILAAAPAYAQFSVNWKPSSDNPLLKGYDYLGAWFFANGYQPSLAAGIDYAKNGYIGKDAGDSDPLYWMPSTLTSKIIVEIAGYANKNKFGAYEQGNASNKTEIFSGPDNSATPAKTLEIDHAYGFYLKTPEGKTWYTDRFLNDGPQHNTPANAGGDAQALVYRLTGDQFLVAFEDLDVTKSGSDNDFNDMWVKITVTPEPVSSALFLMGGAGLLASAVRRKKD